MSAKPRSFSDRQVTIFMFILCFFCASILAIVAYSLSGPQKVAKEFDQSKQMLIAAGILTHTGSFELEGKPAIFDRAKKILTVVKNPTTATDEQIKEIAQLRIRPLLTDTKGDVFTLEEKQITLAEYFDNHRKTGYANLPLKLFYAILPNDAASGGITAEQAAKDLKTVTAIVIPVSGFGLWAPIYGYLAVQPNGDTVIGTTWYDMGETPGLGANITEAWWQSDFKGKLIFHQAADGKVDFQTAEMGIIVVKGKVQDVYGNAPLSKSAVDGISGSTLTGNGVTAAYRDSLTPYRQFLIKLHQQESSSDAKTAA